MRHHGPNNLLLCNDDNGIWSLHLTDIPQQGGEYVVIYVMIYILHVYSGLKQRKGNYKKDKTSQLQKLQKSELLLSQPRGFN